MATHYRMLAWRIPMDRGAWQALVHRMAEIRTRLSGQAQHNFTADETSDRRWVLWLGLYYRLNVSSPLCLPIHMRKP